MEEFKPIKAGVYSIENFIRDKDTITITNDEMLWKDFIFDKGGRGSISTSDTLFRQQYGRGYFVYQPDTIAEIINFKRNDGDTANIFVMKYKIVNDSTIELWGELRTDSVYFRLQRTERHFQLTEKQFHWISESNR